jgi:signal transduction histidine kinase/DNA-binding LacI/PurR family transcriptional regulator/AraC-like DNA-binding protein
MTIGVIMDHVSGESRSSLWPGIADTIRAHGGNLLCFAGGCLHDPHDFTRQGNLVYDFIDPGRLDGLIIWASSLASDVGPECLPRFCARYRPLPMVSIGIVLDGIPGVVLDSYQGMRDAVTHLIEVHGRRRLAFVRGPAGHRDADERYRAYVETLRDYALPFSADLVSPHNMWFDPGGASMVRLLMDERRVDFDAVVCVNDDLAVQAMALLRTRGVRVPEDVSVVGFNDTPLSRAITPPLTTVPWRMYERGQRAAELLLAMLAGEPAPDQVLLPASLIVRQSCGCLPPSVLSALDAAPEPALTVESVGRDAVLSALQVVLDGEAALEGPAPAGLPAAGGDAPGNKAQAAIRLYDAFIGEVTGTGAGGFLPALDRLLRRSADDGSDGLAWQQAIGQLRHHVVSIFLHDQRLLIRAESLLQQARILIGEHVQRAQRYREWQTQQQTQRLRRIGHVLATTTRVPDLMNLLAEELPQLGIERCHLALYEDPAKPTEWCRLALAYDAQGRRDVTPEQARMRTHDLVMSAGSPGDDEPLAGAGPNPPYSTLVQPLHFGDEQLGVVLFEQRSAGDIYEVLREEISVTLKGVLLAERNVELYQQARAAELEATEGRRLAEEADRLKSRFLSMVSHELRTPLVLLVGLSEMMLRERTGDHRPPLPEPYRQDLARIHVSAQQLDSLVRDVLDLTRSQRGQLLLAMERLDLAKLLKAVALVGEQMAHAKGLGWRLDLPDHLPPVSGDPARLRQVVLNLLTNAVKFTACGEVGLRAVEEPGVVRVLVSDTGVGVPEAEQEAIFDEFRQSERTAARGYGGLGIGLALCKEIVDLHGGQIGVRSSGEEQSGATFYFTLPIVREATHVQAERPVASQAVLLLSTRAGGGDRLEARLISEGFEVERLRIDEMEDWQAQVFARTPGAIVLDCAPDSARGWELIERLKQHPNTLDIPVLFYTLPASPDRDAGSLLALDYHTKPLSADALSRALERYGSGSGPQDGKRTVLVVDDDPGIREMHTRVVQAALPGGRVLQASNGRIALEIMRHERPALVLLDLMMPEVDGMRVLAAMQGDARLRGIPVIVLTAQTLGHDEMAQLTAGVAAVLQKGVFTADETLLHIEEALARNRQLGTEAQRTARKAMAYIHEHYAESLSREEVASHVGVSPRHLTRCFQEEVGLSPIAYLNRYRVKQAKALLDAGGSITEVAGGVGFASSGYFTDAFRREVGVSPREYQRRNLAPNS